MTYIHPIPKDSLFNKPSQQVEVKPLPSNGTITSDMAAKSMEPHAPTLRDRILFLLKERPAGLTDEEIADLLHMNPSTARPRRIELVEAGLVRSARSPSADRPVLRRQNRSGNWATVWIAVGGAE